MKAIEKGESQEVSPSASKLETDAKNALSRLKLPEGAEYEVGIDNSTGKAYVNLRMVLDSQKPHSTIETLEMAKGEEDHLDQEFGLLWLQVKDALSQIGVLMDETTYDTFRNAEVKTKSYLLTEGLTRQLSGRIAKLFGKG